MAIPVALAVISALQTAYGIYQQAKSTSDAKKATEELADYDEPSTKMLLRDATLMKSNTEVPAADLYRAKALSQVSQGVEAAERTSPTSSGALGVLQNLYGGYMDFEQNLATQGMQYAAASRSVYQNALREMAGLESRKFYFNEQLPYMQKMKLAGQMGEAANANTQSGVTGLMSYEFYNNQERIDAQRWENQKAFELEKMRMWGEHSDWFGYTNPDGGASYYNPKALPYMDSDPNQYAPSNNPFYYGNEYV